MKQPFSIRRLLGKAVSVLSSMRLKPGTAGTSLVLLLVAVLYSWDILSLFFPGDSQNFWHVSPLSRVQGRCPRLPLDLEEHAVLACIQDNWPYEVTQTPPGLQGSSWRVSVLSQSWRRWVIVLRFLFFTCGYLQTVDYSYLPFFCTVQEVFLELK